MKYPKEVRVRIDVLSEYQENEKLETFNIVHLYDDGLCYPDGYYDSRFFKLVGFNTTEMEKRDLGRHDSLDLEREFGNAAHVAMVRIFADGSTMVKFINPVKIQGYYQNITLGE